MNKPILNSKAVEITRGALPGSRKRMVDGVPFREVALDGGEAPVRLYDTSGPYTDDTATIDIEKGLAATVHEHLRVYGTIEKLLKPAPPEVWRDMLFGVAVTGKHFKRFSQISLHSELQQSLPFAAIDYLELPKAA